VEKDRHSLRHGGQVESLSGGEFVRWRVCQVDAAKKGRQKKHPDELGSTVVPNN